MADEKTTTPSDNTKPAQPERGNRGDRNNRGGRNPRPRREKGADDKYDSNLINVRRVARQYHGGRRMRFSTFVVIGDREGSVGVGVGKAKDIPSAQRKAKDSAQKSMINVPLKGNTIPHAVDFKYKSSRVLLMPAAPGTGVVAGKTVKAVAELAGIKDLLTKVLGSTNAINTAYATVEALKALRSKRI
jgi:small subunit ribosomal protein S5